MAYAKAVELLDLALEIAARRYGMPYALIEERSGARNKEARERYRQRIVRALRQVFPDRIRTGQNDAGEMCVYMDRPVTLPLLDPDPEEMAALDRAILLVDQTNSPLDADALRRLRAKVRLLIPTQRNRQFEVDHEALLAAAHFMVRPGPRPVIDPLTIRPLTEALLAIRQVTFDYQAGAGSSARRRVHPYGILFGHRAYLVARIDSAKVAGPAIWRMDRMSDVAPCEEAAQVPADFDLEKFARRSFGAFHRDDEYDDVEWRFSAEVAENVLTYRFHPDQQLTRNPDGSVTVRFRASGHIEMAWALYPWGNHVEVIRPEAVKRLVEGYQRSDFAGIP